MKSVGEKISKTFGDASKFVMPEDMNILQEVVSAGGSAGAFFIPGLGIAKGVSLVGFTGRLALATGVTVSSAFESLVVGGEVYKNALERGVPNNEAVKLGTSASFADLPVGVLVNSFGLFGDSGKAIAKKLKIKPGTSGKIGNFITGSLEGAQEFYQRVIQNVSENAPATQGALKDGALGS